MDTCGRPRYVLFCYALHKIQLILAQKAMLLAMKLPPAQKKLQEELNKVKVDIEDMLVPKGGEFTRYLALPAQGKSTVWILEEMARMDKELGAHTDWGQGKLSGAVYCMSLLRRFSSSGSLSGQTGVMISPRWSLLRSNAMLSRIHSTRTSSH